MRKGLHLVLVVFMVLFIVSSAFTAAKDIRNSPQTYVHIEHGMQHNMVVMNQSETGKKAVVDTIQHYFTGTPATDWVPGIYSYALVGDTLANWFSFASDSATVIGIQASFTTAGTGSWNVWFPSSANSYNPDTQTGQLFFDVPWTVTADTAVGGVATGNLQTLDLEGQGLAANVIPPLNDQGVPGVYVGYYYDANVQPGIWMDPGGHPRDPGFFEPGGWEFAKHWLTSQGGGWFFWASATQWVEFTMKLIVRYEAVAPFISNITDLPDYFAGNDVLDKTIYADIVDLDGTIQSADLNYQVRGTAIVNTEAMSVYMGDTYSGNFTISFAAGDTIDYWIEATDDGGNMKSTAGGDFVVVPTPAVGTDVLFVVEGGDGGETTLEQALMNLSKVYYVWSVDDHGSISSFELNYGFNNIVWYGFGSSSMPSPFETGSNGMATYLDNGGYLMLLDKDYLFIHGYVDSVLQSGQFGYDYLGMEDGFSDPAVGDTVYYGFAGDPISAAYLMGVDSVFTMPAYFGTWSATSGTDWSDYVNANAMGANVLYTPQSVGYGYNSAIRYEGAGFATAFFPVGLEAAAQTQIDDVVGNTLAWFEVLSTVGENPSVVHSYQLHQNYPNPFNPTTEISYSIQAANNVELTIYNALGQKIKTLVNQEMTAGTHNVMWNGLDSRGKAVASGVYIYELKSGDFQATQKMLLIK